jgi:hypothetical protein
MFGQTLSVWLVYALTCHVSVILAYWSCLSEHLADMLLQDITLQNVDVPMINNVVEFGERGVLRVRRRPAPLVPDCMQ